MLASERELLDLMQHLKEQNCKKTESVILLLRMSFHIRIRCRDRHTSLPCRLREGGSC